MGRKKREVAEPPNREAMPVRADYAYRCVYLERTKYAKFRRENEDPWGRVRKCDYLP